MVRAKRIDLARLSIAALIEAFADAMTAALAGRHAIRIEHWAAWTVMAATLTELWSRLLLPADAPGGACRRGRGRGAAPAAARARPDARSRRLAGAAAATRTRGVRPGHATSERRPAVPAISPSCCAPAWSRCACRRRRRPRFARGRRRLWQVTDAIARMQRLLDVLPDGSPLSDFLPAPDGAEPDRALRPRAAVASTLVAGLELARTGTLALDQDAAWTAIRVGRRHDHRDAATAVPGPAA